MKIATFSRFNGWVGPSDTNGGGGQLNPDVRYVAIAPGSDVDCCLVNGRLLAPGYVLPAAEGASLVPVRSIPSGGIAGGNAGVSDAVDRLELLTWTGCETPVPPGPLAPRYDTWTIPFSTFVAAGSGVYVRAARFGVQGRSAFRGFVRSAITGGTGVTFNQGQRSVTYLGRSQVLGDPSLEPHNLDFGGFAFTNTASTLNSDIVSTNLSNVVDGSLGFRADELQIFLSATWATPPTGGSMVLYLAADVGAGERVL